MNDQTQLLNLLSALKATKDDKKTTMKEFNESIKGIERQIETLRQALSGNVDIE